MPVQTDAQRAAAFSAAGLTPAQQANVISGTPSTAQNAGVTSWYLSPWTSNAQGQFTQAPTLTVNGTPFTSSDPNAYIAKLNEIKGLGATGPVDQFISQFQGILPVYNSSNTTSTAPTSTPAPAASMSAPAAQPTQQLSYPTAALQPGSTDTAAVKQLQDYLVAHGYLTAAQEATGPGTYGPQTTAAVLALQKNLGIDYSSGPGDFGPITIAALNNTHNATSTPTGVTQSLPQTLTAAGATSSQADQLAATTLALPPGAANPYANAKNYTGSSIDDFLTLAGQPNDMASRTALAQKLGIANYTGTAAQNTQMLTTLKGIAQGTTSAGVPNVTGTTLGSPTVPTPNTPIDLSKLTAAATGNNGNLDLSSILGAGANSSSTSSLAGIIALLTGKLPGQAGYDATGQQLVSAMNSMGNEGTDTITAENNAGVPAIQGHIADLSTLTAKQSGDLQAFDAETQQGLSNVENQAIPTGLISGQQAQYQKQRALTRSSMAAELASNTALLQAYQGNLSTAISLATQSVQLKYAPIQANIDSLKEQLSLASTELANEDKTRSSVITTILDAQSKQLSLQVDQQTKLQTIGVQAASGGAPLSLVQQALATGDPVQASALLSKYLKGPTETTADLNAQVGLSSGAKTFTQTQLNNGAADAGMTITDFAKLGPDVQNFFINAKITEQTSSGTKSVSGGQGLKDVIAAVKSGDLSPADAKATFANMPAAIVSYVNQQIDAAGNGSSSSSSGLSGFLGNVGSAIGNAGSSVLSWLGL